MPWVELVLWLIAVMGAWEVPGERPAPAASERATAAQVDFAKDVQPILEARCQPCHFPGGKMHATLPFDQPGTITKLGEKLFTRIKAEEERLVIRWFLEATGT